MNRFENYFMTVAEAATFLRVSRATIYDWVHQRLIAHRKHGGRLVFVRNDIEQWSKSKEVRPLADRFKSSGDSGIKPSCSKAAKRSFTTKYPSNDLTSEKEV